MIRLAISLLFVTSVTRFLHAQPPAGEVRGHADLIHSIAFSPDGKMVATAGFDKEIKLWEYADGNLKEVKTLSGHSDPVYCVVFSPDGKRLASSSHDKTIRVWNVADGKVLQTLKGATDIVDTIAFSPDGKLLASGSGTADKSVRLWNPDDGKEVKNLGAHNGSVYCVAFSPDGKLLASSGADNIIKVWDVPGQKELMQLKGHELGVTGVVFAGDDKTLVSVSQDRSVRVWNLDAKEAETIVVLVDCLARLQMKSKKNIKEVFVEKPTIVGVDRNPGNAARMVLRGLQQGTTRIDLSDTDGGKQSYKVVVQTDTGEPAKDAKKDANTIIVPVGGQVPLQMKSKKLIKDVFFNKPTILKAEPDLTNLSGLILKGLKQGTTQLDLTDVDGGEESFKVVVPAGEQKDSKEPGKDAPKKDVPKKDAKDTMKKDAPKEVKDEKDFHEVKKFGPTPDDLYAVSWSKDAKAIVTAGYAGNISLWNLNDPKPKFTKKLKSLAYCIAFSPDGKAALSGHGNGFIYVTPLQ